MPILSGINFIDNIFENITTTSKLLYLMKKPSSKKERGYEKYHLNS
jgi:hypothetical protein